MLISLHKQATTTPKIRAAIQASSEPAWAGRGALRDLGADGVEVAQSRTMSTTGATRRTGFADGR